MKRMLFLAILIPAAALLTMPAGCTKKAADTDDDRPKEKFVGSREKGTGGAQAARLPLKAGDGVVRGRVVLQGERPVMSFIGTMKTHNDAAVCLAGSDAETKDQKWIIGDNNGVANVVISLKPPAGKYFEPKDEDRKLAEKKVLVRQPHCAFIPHVSAIYPSYWDGKELQATGEKFIVINDAPVNHNTAWVGGLKNPRGSQTIPPKGELPINLVPEPQPIQISCDIHPWMYGRVWVFDHPYFAVTNADGAFEIKNVPTGVDLGVVAWHEAKDYFHGGKEGVKQKFNSGDNKVELTIAAN